MDYNKGKKMKKIIIASFLIILPMLLVLGALYTQKYTQNTKNTAIKGIFFQQQLNLEHYKNVSSGLNAWGKYDRYSRSDRHDDVITVYCQRWCKDK